MADNVISNPGSGGATFATDEIGSVHYPKTKIVWGPDDQANSITSSGGFPVEITDSLGTALGRPASPLIVDTEASPASPLADAMSNPTAGLLGAPLLVWNGVTWDRVRGANVHKDLSAVTITSITTVWTPTSGKKFRLMGGCISVSAAANVLFEDNAAGAGNFICRTPKLLADTPYNFDLGNGYLSSAANNVLKATASAAAAVTGFLYGTEE